MDVRIARSQANGQHGGQGRPPGSVARAVGDRKPLSERIGETLGQWQAPELRVARRFPECRGLNPEQLEDIYQETVLALLHRPYVSEEHLRNALRTGIKHRALNLHRDERRRQAILTQRAPELHLKARAAATQDTPEIAVLLEQDHLIVAEFKTELTNREQEVFALLAEGLRYRAIATVLSIKKNEARKVSRACERKRERFQFLYNSGRLCGFRSHTILALQSGEATSEELATRAIAHLESCGRCRVEHKTNAKRLRRSFQDQAAALLPLPVLVSHLGWLARLGLRTRAIQERLTPEAAPAGSGALRERALALLAGGGVSAKVTTGVVTVAVLAGSAATHVLNAPPTHHHHHIAKRTPPPVHVTRPAADLAQAAQARPTRGPIPLGNSPGRTRQPGPGHVISNRRVEIADRASTQHGTGAFPPLGLPRHSSTTAPAHTPAQRGGGPFGP